MNDSSPPPNPPQPQTYRQIALGLWMIVLLGVWMTIFTFGSQVPSSAFENPLVKFITRSTPNILILGCVSGMIGVLKRHIGDPEKKPFFAEYASGVISGFITAIAVLAFPGIVSSMTVAGNRLFVPDQGTYNVFSLVASYLSYQSGLDLGFSDRLTKRVFQFLKI